MTGFEEFLKEFGIPDDPSQEGNRNQAQQQQGAIRKTFEDYSKRLRVGNEFDERSIDLIEDWQSTRTKSVKRFIFGMAFILVGALLVEADFSQISIFGLQPTGARGTWLVWYFIIIILSLEIIFELSYSVDNGRRQKRCKDIENKIPNALRAYLELSIRLKNHNVSFRELTKAIGLPAGSSDLEKRYRLIQKYSDTLHRHHKTDMWLRYIDVLSVRAGVLLSLIALSSALFPSWGITVMPPVEGALTMPPAP